MFMREKMLPPYGGFCGDSKVPWFSGGAWVSSANCPNEPSCSFLNPFWNWAWLDFLTIWMRFVVTWFWNIINDFVVLNIDVCGTEHSYHSYELCMTICPFIIPWFYFSSSHPCNLLSLHILYILKESSSLYAF